MSRHEAFLLCALAALSPATLASGDGSRPVPGAGEKDPAPERGVAALFSWGDLDGDGRLDLAAVTARGALQVLTSTADGRFEDVTERLGLGGVSAAALALWADYDADGRLDLFVGARSGASRLFHNEGGSFTDMSAGSGLVSEGAVQSALWLDHDGDGRLDLFVTTEEGNEPSSALFRGLEGGFFERAELPLAGLQGPGLGAPLPNAGVAGEGAGGSGTQPAPGSTSDTGRVSQGRSIVGNHGVGSAGRSIVLALPRGGVPSLPVLAAPSTCASSILDANTLNPCIEASATPTLGMLYPLSTNLFVAAGGNVGIGTTSPTARLHVAGTARMTDTLTLAPGGDTALDVSTGSIYKGGALFIHTKGTINNTALGRTALASVTGAGGNNTAIGDRALFSSTVSSFSTATGSRALESNTTGENNTATGAYALNLNTIGEGSVAIGADALRANTSGSFNTAAGAQALRFNTTGLRNTATGYDALGANTTGSRNTASGFHALRYNTIGILNDASGEAALKANTTGDRNAAVGAFALTANTTGDRNIAIGALAGYYLTTGDDNIVIGNYGVFSDAQTIRIGTPSTHNLAFIAGIRGVTTGVADAIPVLVDSAGQLGTVSSSRRFKQDIADMGDRTERLLELRPVVFHYKQEQTVPTGEVPLEYGLIAEEVAEIFPDLVVYDEEGQPFTVKYHLMSSMLLNELKKQAVQMDELRAELVRQRRESEARFAALESRPGTEAAPASIGAER